MDVIEYGELQASRVDTTHSPFGYTRARARANSALSSHLFHAHAECRFAFSTRTNARHTHYEGNMANTVYDELKYQALRAGIALHTDDVRLLLVMSNTTAATDRTAQTITGITTLDECDAVGYTSGGVALTGEAVARDGTGHRGFFDAADASFANLAAGTRQVAGMILYIWKGSLGASIPIAFFDTPGFPFWGNGSTMTVQWNASGILQIS